ncbi:MAG: ABC transporter ATP-binding protein [Planctomycetota bacterium]|jgi:molybdopterin-binding protein
MLSVRGISKTFPGFGIKDVSFEVQEGEYFVLLGKTGVGKSVLLEIVAGLTSPDSGSVLLDGRDITHEKMQNRRISLVFQSSALFPHMNVYDNIAYPLRWCGKAKSEVDQRVAELAEDFTIRHLLQARPQTLSGGESQRVSLARAVASDPRCLLLDEPLSSLDATSRSEIRALLRKISANGQLIVHVTHDYTEAVSLSTHIAVIEDGGIAQIGTVEEIFQHPKSHFVARFVGIRNFFKGRLEAPEGEKTSLKHFSTDGLSFSVLTGSPAGPGSVMVRSEDVTITNTAIPTSARNNFQGPIVDMAPVGGGVEIIVDIGMGEPAEIAALVTKEAVSALKLSSGKRVWLSFKAAAAKFIEG